MSKATNITLTIPADRKDEVIAAISATYGVEATMDGLKDHLMQHLRNTTLDVRASKVAAEAREEPGF